MIGSEEMAKEREFRIQKLKEENEILLNKSLKS